MTEIWNHLRRDWRSYLPAAGLFGAALFFTVLPSLAVLLVTSSLFVFGILYAWIVFRFHRFRQAQQEFYRESSTQRSSAETESFRSAWGSFDEQWEPTFRNVSFRIIRREN